MTSSKHLTHTFRPSNHYDTTPDWDRLKDTREPGVGQHVHPDFHPSTFPSLAHTPSTKPNMICIYKRRSSNKHRRLHDAANVSYLKTWKIASKNAVVCLSRMHDMSCENISLEMLSTAIYYCEDIERLEEEPWWRTHGPLTNSLQKGVSAWLLKTSDLLWHRKSPHSCQGALIAPAT